MSMDGGSDSEGSAKADEERGGDDRPTGSSQDCGYFLEFDSSGDRDLCLSDLTVLKQKITHARSVFTDRTDDASATQYFQFYGCEMATSYAKMLNSLSLRIIRLPFIVG